MNGSTFNQIRIFQAIAQEGSISGAAKTLEMAPPSVSQALKSLENELGLPLFTRTTRKIELTQAGQKLYESTRDSIQSLSLAYESVSDLTMTPRGQVRITVPRFVYQKVLAPIYAEFCRRYPDICLEISIYDGTVDIIEQGFDLGIRFGSQVADGMIARQLVKPHNDVLFASPSYLAKFGTPKTISELQGHKLIYYRFISAKNVLPFTVMDGDEEVSVALSPALIVNDTDLIIDSAKQGLGIGRLLEPMISQELADGSLVPILERHWHKTSGLYLYFHQNTQKAQRVRVFIDFVIEQTQHWRA